MVPNDSTGKTGGVGSPDSYSKRDSTLGYFGATIIFGLVTAVLGPTLPGLAENVRTSLSQISLIFTVQALGFLLGSMISGRLIDRLPGNRLMAGILFSLAGIVFWIPVIEWFWLLILAFGLLGLTLGSLEVGANTLMVWVHGRKVGPYMNALHFFFGVGAITAPIIVARTSGTNGDFRWSYWLLAACAVPVLLWLMRLRSPREPGGQEAGQILPENRGLVFLVALILFLYVGAESSYGGWIYTYTIRQFGEGMEATGTGLTSAFWGALTFGRLVSIPLAMRVRPRIVLIGDLVGCLISVGLIALWPRSLPIVWAGSIGLGFFMAAFFPTTVTLAGRRMQINGKVSGWFFFGGGAGGLILPWLIGQLFESIGPTITLVLIFIDLAAALGVLALLLALPATTPRHIASVSEGD